MFPSHDRRGLRTAPEKENCLILDFGQVIKTLGPIDQINIRSPQQKNENSESESEPVLKRCPSCATMCAAAQRFCYICGYELFSLELDVSAESQNKVLSEPETHTVIGMDMKVWAKKGAEPDAPKTLRVSYTTLAGTFHEWLCFEHWQFEDKRKFAYKKAEDWHNNRIPNKSCPCSAEAASFMPYPKPDKITVKKDGKYWRITNYDFQKKQEEEEIFDEIPF